MWLIAAGFRPLDNTDVIVAARNLYREHHLAVVSKKMCTNRSVCTYIARMTTAKTIDMMTVVMMMMINRSTMMMINRMTIRNGDDDD